MYFMKMIFVKRDWTSDKKKIEETFSQIKNLKTDVWIISYLEGSRITPEKVKAVSITLLLLLLLLLLFYYFINNYLLYIFVVLFYYILYMYKSAKNFQRRRVIQFLKMF